MLLGILALLFGTLILATWYIQTFTDTSYGKNSCFISTTFHAHPKSDAIGFPATGVVFIFAAIVIICNELKLPNLVINSLLILTLLVILISLIWQFELVAYDLAFFSIAYSPLGRRSIPVHEAPRNAGQER